METAVKQRLIGAAVLAALAMIFLPMLLQSPDVTESDASQVPLKLPKAPEGEFETRELPLLPPAAPGSDVTAPASPAEADPNAVVTVDAAQPAARTDEAAPAVAIDAATGQPLPPAEEVPAPTAAEATAPSPAPPAEPAVAVPPATPAQAPLPPQVAAGNYAVNVGSFGNLDNARALATKLRAAQLPVSSETVDLAGKPGMRLRVGPYAERAAAEAARLRVQAVAGAQGQVIALDAAAPAPAASATAAAKPAAATPRPTAATVGFAVQLGALRVEADAIALRDRARAAGFVAFHQRMDTANGVLFRVRVGPEADRAAADALRAAVQTRLGIAGLVVSHP